MKITIDTESQTLTADGETLPLYSDQALEHVMALWTRVAWNQKYSYTFSWFGVPIIQVPEDMVRFQEVVTELKPDVIIETGVAHGGSAVYSASLCQMMNHGRVIAIDIEIRPHNRARIEAHPLAHRITLLEGSSTAPDIVSAIGGLVKQGETVLVVLDSNHSYQHVMDELNAYAELVTPGSYIIATDGVMQDLTDAPRGDATWSHDNPARAARDFVAANPNFELGPPKWPFNESGLSTNVTHWPDAWIRRIR